MSRKRFAATLPGSVANPLEVMLQPGSVLADKYVVERELGRGGMGVVVAARHQELDEMCAVKLLRIDQEDYRAEMLGRFRREARVSAKVRSEHVLRVYDAGRLSDGTPYMVMELLEGEDLATILYERGALPPQEVVRWMLQACEGLAALHAAGVVHRDLKPENLFLERLPDGSRRIKILDLGIAKVHKRHSIPDDGQRLTIQAGAMGTPPYMAPEQITKPEEADARADIWAMGTLLYALLTGKDAFASQSQHDSMLHILTARHTPIRVHRNELAASLEIVVDRCLQKDPAARFQSVVELAQALVHHGPEDAAVSVRRVARMMGVDSDPTRLVSARPPVSSNPPLRFHPPSNDNPSASSNPPGPARKTLTPITSRRGAPSAGSLAPMAQPPPDRRRVTQFAILACALVALTLGGFVVWKAAPTGEAEEPTAASAGVEAASEVSERTPAPQPVAMTPPPVASASAPPADPPVAKKKKGAPAVGADPIPKAPAPKAGTPTPPPPKEDLFDDRK